MSKRKQPTRGGAREGAGRKPIGDVPMTRYAVMLDEQTADILRALGAGNLSAGIRAAIARVRRVVEVDDRYVSSRWVASRP